MSILPGVKYCNQIRWCTFVDRWTIIPRWITTVDRQSYELSFVNANDGSLYHCASFTTGAWFCACLFFICHCMYEQHRDSVDLVIETVTIGLKQRSSQNFERNFSITNYIIQCRNHFRFILFIYFNFLYKPNKKKLGYFRIRLLSLPRHFAIC